MNESWLMYSSEIKFFKFSNYFVRQVISHSCWWWSWKQEILDNKWIIIKNLQNTLNIPKKLKVLNREFIIEDLNNDTSIHMYWTLEDNKEIKDEFSIKDDIWWKILKKLKDEEYFPKRYTIYFKEYPWIKFVYLYNEEQPEKVVYLWTDKDFLNKNIDKDWNLLDVKTSNEILSSYGSDLWLVDDIWNSFAIIKKISIENIPIFRVEKFTNDWYYLLYPAKWYKFTSFAEMCKPVIYVYTKENKKLNLNVDLYWKWFFTKLIPQFSTWTTWNFETDNWKVKLENKSYDYLYYSAKVKDYKFNNDWWIVKWDEMKDFF